MIIPWNTDAPLYHFPYATIGLIVANTLAFIASASLEDPTPWMLAFGEGLHPIQWLTSIFMHEGILHLVGNMLFLWGFGLVIEGKIGWWRFLLVYLGLGIFESAVVQILMQHKPGYALGASGAIYGLLAMALIWAPRNEMSCLALLSFRPIHFEISILTFVTLFVSYEFITAWLTDFEISSAMLHLAGAIPGFALGIGMLKLDYVDCEHFDVFSVLAGHEGEAPKPKLEPTAPPANSDRGRAQREAALQHFAEHLAQGRAAEALKLHDNLTKANVGWQLNEPQLMALVKSLHGQKLWLESLPPMVESLRRFPDNAARMRLRLAQILILHANRPGQALRVLEKLPAQGLEPALQNARRQLVAQADAAHEDGDLELESEDW